MQVITIYVNCEVRICICLYIYSLIYERSSVSEKFLVLFHKYKINDLKEIYFIYLH